jgi:hypothetical protein
MGKRESRTERSTSNLLDSGLLRPLPTGQSGLRQHGVVVALEAAGTEASAFLALFFDGGRWTEKKGAGGA